MATLGLEALGWDAAWASTWAAAAAEFGGTDAGDPEAPEPARVVVAHRDGWQVVVADRQLSASIAGRMRDAARGATDLPAVGDWVAVQARPVEGTATIVSLLPRRSAVVRTAGEGGRRTGSDAQVLAANVDVALVVAGLDHELNLARLERYLAVAWSSGATPVVVLNKADVDTDVDAHRRAVEAIAPGVDVLAISAREGRGLDEVRMHLTPGLTAVVLGSSGVGKSTLINALLGDARQETGAVRDGDSRGRHTTVVRELITMPGGVVLIDTPGLRSLSVAGAGDGLADAFSDIGELAAACRFRDCHHDGEPGCAVQAAVDDGRLDADRLARYHKLERELAMVARRADPVAAREERRKWSAIGRSVSVHMKAKYGEDTR